MFYEQFRRIDLNILARSLKSFAAQGLSSGHCSFALCRGSLVFEPTQMLLFLLSYLTSSGNWLRLEEVGFAFYWFSDRLLEYSLKIAWYLMRSFRFCSFSCWFSYSSQWVYKQLSDTGLEQDSSEFLKSLHSSIWISRQNIESVIQFAVFRLINTHTHIKLRVLRASVLSLLTITSFIQQLQAFINPYLGYVIGNSGVR